MSKRTWNGAIVAMMSLLAINSTAGATNESNAAWVAKNSLAMNRSRPSPSQQPGLFDQELPPEAPLSLAGVAVREVPCRSVLTGRSTGDYSFNCYCERRLHASSVNPWNSFMASLHALPHHSSRGHLLHAELSSIAERTMPGG